MGQTLSSTSIKITLFGHLGHIWSTSHPFTQSMSLHNIPTCSTDYSSCSSLLPRRHYLHLLVLLILGFLTLYPANRSPNPHHNFLKVSSCLFPYTHCSFHSSYLLSCIMFSGLQQISIILVCHLFIRILCL